jgi:hypothetical protein
MTARSFALRARAETICWKVKNASRAAASGHRSMLKNSQHQATAEHDLTASEMTMTEKLTSAEIIHIAVTWAEESTLQMIGGCPEDDSYRAEVADQLKQMRAYRKRRFGKPANPFEGASLIGLDELRKMSR